MPVKFANATTAIAAAKKMSDFTTDVVAGMTSLEQASALHSGFVFVLCGLLGVYGFEQARQAHAYQSERQGKILDEFKETGDYAQALKRFEVTVSQAIHDTSAPHGVIFRAIFLALALLHLQAGAVHWELYPLQDSLPNQAAGGLLTLLGALRTVLAPTASVLIVFVPTGAPLVSHLP